LRIAVPALGLLALLAVPGVARAEIPRGVYWLGGVNVGGAAHDRFRTGGVIVGFEGSLVYTPGAAGLVAPWVGAYADVLADLGPPAGARFSLGPEAGFGPVGIDAGYAGAVYLGSYYSGLAVRVVATIGWAALYARYEHFFGETSYRNIAEFGLLLKWVDVRARGRLFAKPDATPPASAPAPSAASLP